MSCDTFGSDIKTQLQDYGDYNCDGALNIVDIMALVRDILGGNTNKNIVDIMNIVTKILDTSQDHVNALQQIILSQAPSQDDSDTGQRAETILADADVAFVNIPKNPDNFTEGFDIFFKGPEVLEYQVTFTGGGIENSIKTSENGDVFHNLFSGNWINNNPNHAEQAFVIDGDNNTVYQARRSDASAWPTDLIHMFSTDSNISISQVNKIRYATNTDLTDNTIIETNAGLVSVLPPPVQ